MKKTPTYVTPPMPTNLGPAPKSSSRMAVASPLVGARVWVVSAMSESGDHFGPWLFVSKPSDEKMEAFLRERCAEEFEEEGAGVFGSTLHIRAGYREVNE